jgi:hypothetical protein
VGGGGGEESTPDYFSLVVFGETDVSGRVVAGGCFYGGTSLRTRGGGGRGDDMAVVLGECTSWRVFDVLVVVVEVPIWSFMIRSIYD